DELRFSEIEQRLLALEEQAASQQGIQSASYLSDEESATGFADSNCDSPVSCDSCREAGNGDCGGKYYAEVQLTWMRLHLEESVAGKLSESYDISPRIIMGYEDACGVGGRVRYWHYDENTDIVTNGGGDIRFQLDVFDVEAANRFHVRRTDIVLAGGIRFADVEVVDVGNNNMDNSMLGLTLAADLQTSLWSSCGNRLSGVYGGRLSLLGGDWERGAGEGLHDFMQDVRDDNLVVQELYGGLQYSYCYGGYDLYTRFTWEMQSWASDAILGADKFGFVGPALHFGANF
ncbi:MAG: hypothetical protein L0Z07_03850, partial [Planctomycetes bacterium]|nr:hypothetical protein [Planctomycetota bacterium]